MIKAGQSNENQQQQQPLAEKQQTQQQPQEQQKQQLQKQRQKEIGPQQEVAELNSKLADYTETLKRLQAEFENYKKRAENEKAEFKDYAEAGLVRQILPVLDSFEAALKAIDANNQPADYGKLAHGFRFIYSQLKAVLHSNGLQEIQAVGQKTDPFRHEVLMEEELSSNDAAKDGTVVDELQKGYTYKGIVLRCSKVKIGRFKAAKEETEEKTEEGI